jgi:HAD superfamily hydrolase (TIGR01509 family)
MNLRERDYWIFDMDGTLTVAAHDFDAIRTTLGLPPDQPILEVLATLPTAQAEALHRRLDEIELQLAREARPQPGTRALLFGLQQRGVRLGIVTRNSRRNAYETLRACGLLDFFEAACVLGRESAAPKPAPDGINKLLAHWNAAPSQAVMVGDYLFDLVAGRRAGTATVYVDVAGHNQWAEQADLRVQNLGELLALVKGPNFFWD